MTSMMSMELMHWSKEITRGRPDLIQLLMLLSLVKEDLPWLYELAVDAYQQSARKLSGAKEARRRLLMAIKQLQLRDGPVMELFDNKDNYIIFRDIQHLSKDIMNSYESEELTLTSKALNVNKASLSKQTDTK